MHTFGTRTVIIVLRDAMWCGGVVTAFLGWFVGGFVCFQNKWNRTGNFVRVMCGTDSFCDASV